MKQFLVFGEDHVGELARVAEALAQNAINVRGLATDRCDGRPTVHVVTDDEASTRSALRNAGFRFEESEVVVIDLMDRPGEIAKVARRAATAGVNIDSVFLIGKKGTPVSIVLTTGDRKKMDAFLEASSK